MIQPIDLFNGYNEIYTQSFIVHPDVKDNEYSVTLTEDDRTAKLKKLTVSNVPKNTILLPLHKYSDLCLGNILKNILKSASGIFKCCDYLIVTIAKGKLYLVFIEMKSKEINSVDIKKQFKGASCFIEYCNSIIEYFCNMPSRKSLTINTRYVSVYGNKLNKTPTRRRCYTNHSSPDNFLPYMVGIDDNAASIPFELLL